MLDEKVFSDGFAVLCDVVKEVDSKRLAEIYYDALSDLTDAEFQRAVKGSMRTNKYHKLPMPAELREHATLQESPYATGLNEQINKLKAAVEAERKAEAEEKWMR